MNVGAPDKWRKLGRGSRDLPPTVLTVEIAAVRIRIKTLPALRYEGFDLSSYQVGQSYEVEGRLAELLVDRGYAEPDTCSDSDRATDNEVDIT